MYYPAPFTHLNRDFYVKVSSAENPKGRLIGVYGLISLLGEELSTKLVKRALNAKSDKLTCKLRRGLKFDFYVK